MFESNGTLKKHSTLDRNSFYSELEKELLPTLDQVWFTNLSNTAAILWHYLPDINWVGFYLNKNEKLWLGPFQGLPACLMIDFSRGVCGKSARTRSSVVVEDIHTFEGHIACDSNSRSEIVIPLILENRLLGVLDVDSPNLARFNEEDRVGLEKIVRELVRVTRWPEEF
ncbi:MAG: GAF domain-containing protein [Pseudobdellovibrionaceae bacterium]